ncbi:MAG: hypothetical protein K2M08_05035 [Anaeroplasmataceae bacterium]|nr:hypothetical protein [Anaeroplasmataceae bacterium]
MKEKKKYTCCPFCGSQDILYFDTLTKEMFDKKYGNKTDEELTWYEKKDRDLYLEYDEEEVAAFLKDDKKEGRSGVCKTCGMEFREFVNPKLDARIKSMTKIPIEEYLDTMSKELASLPTDSNEIPLKELLLDAIKLDNEHKKFYYKEIMEEEIKNLAKASEYIKKNYKIKEAEENKKED